MRLIVAISGATGAIFGIRLLEQLRLRNVETALILSEWAKVTIQQETSFTIAQVEELATTVYSNKNLGAAIASGSYLTDGMIVAPCSMKSLAAIRAGLANDLIARAADVVLKEQRRLILMPRETPLNAIHLENMLALHRMGVQIVPPMPAFYNHPKTLDDMINSTVERVLDQLQLGDEEAKRWQGLISSAKNEEKRGTPHITRIS